MSFSQLTRYLEKLTLFGEYHNRDKFRHITTGGLERNTHYRIRDPDGVAEYSCHPRCQVGRYCDPYHTHNERYQIPVSPSFISTIRYSNKQD